MRRIFQKYILPFVLILCVVLPQTGCLFPPVPPEVAMLTLEAQTEPAQTTEAGTDAPESTPAQTTDAAANTTPAETTAAPDGGETAPPIPEYYHYEKEPFLENVKAMTAAADAETALALYDRLYGDVLEIMTLRTVAEIAYDTDTTDEKASEETSYTYEVLLDCGDAFLVACKDLTEGPYKDAFKAHVGEEAFEAYNEYRAMSDEEFELSRREDELEDQYDAVWNRLDDFTFEYEGTVWTFSKLNGIEGSMLYYRDAESYFDVVYGLEGAIFETVGPIYVELVQIRDRIAKLNDYDDYVAYAYDTTYGRDFSAEDAQVFCNAVKSVSKDAYALTAYQGASYADISASFTPDSLIEQLGAAAKDLDPEIYTHWEYLKNNRLYNIGTEEVRLDASFSTYLQSTQTPYIFCKLGGTFRDFTTISHEFGHFINFHSKKEENVLICPDRYDLSEIHSNGLELLMPNEYELLFGDKAAAAAHSEISDAISGILDGCLYDEFQRRVYQNPGMTAEEIRDLFYELCVEYGKDENDWGLNYDWMFVPHNFSSPLYYLSYAVSGVGALEIWETSRTNLSDGIALWKKVLSYSDNDLGYLEVAKACGLHPITQGDDVVRILQSAMDFVR